MNKIYYPFIIVALLFCSKGVAQRYAFSYDNTGNRTERQFLMLRTVSSQSNSEISSYVDAHHVRLYPNPSSDVLYIDSEQIPDEISLYNANGQRMDVSMTRNETLSMDVSPFPAGTYFLRIRFDKYEKSWKVILQ